MGVAIRKLGSVTNDTLSASRSILTSTVVSFSYWVFGSLALDLVVTSISILFLWRSKTGLVELDQVVMHIITITLESAAWPSICMLVAASLYHASPHTRDHLILFFVLLSGKLYTIGMLRTLNSRAKLRVRMREIPRFRSDVLENMGMGSSKDKISGISVRTAQIIRCVGYNTIFETNDISAECAMFTNQHTNCCRERLSASQRSHSVAHKL